MLIRVRSKMVSMQRTYNEEYWFPSHILVILSPQ